MAQGMEHHPLPGVFYAVIEPEIFHHALERIGHPTPLPAVSSGKNVVWPVHAVRTPPHQHGPNLRRNMGMAAHLVLGVADVEGSGVKVHVTPRQAVNLPGP